MVDSTVNCQVMLPPQVNSFRPRPIYSIVCFSKVGFVAILPLGVNLHGLYFAMISLCRLYASCANAEFGGVKVIASTQDPETEPFEVAVERFNCVICKISHDVFAIAVSSCMLAALLAAAGSGTPTPNHNQQRRY